VLRCLLAALLFGAATPASKALLDTLPPITLAGLLYLGAACGVLPFSFQGGSPGLRRDRTNILRVAGAVIAGGIVAPVLLLVGLSRAPAASVALWLNLEVVATALLARAFFREHLERRAWVAVALMLLGGALLATPSRFGTASAALAVALACLSWALDNNLTSLIDGFTPAQYALAKGIVAGAFNLGLGSAVEGGWHGFHVIFVALGVGAASYGLSLMLYVAGAQEIGAARSQMLFAAAPFFGSVLAWGVLGEPVRLLQLSAALIMLVSMAILLSARHAHVHVHVGMAHAHSHRHDDAHHEHVHPGLPAHTRHTHPHAHEPLTHEHPHAPDLHHRHGH
jgi:drug/metabolite transporter (DMT)-like permease